MNQQEFQKKLALILRKAEDQGSHIRKDSIQQFFQEEPLSPEQLALICDYLLSRKIAVEGYARAEEEREEKQPLQPEDEKFLRRYRQDASGIPPCSPEERALLFQRAARGEASALQRLSEVYLLPVADLAEKLYVPEIPVADLVQEGNLHVMLAARELPPETEDRHAWLLERVRQGMEALIAQQQDVRRRDRKMVRRVDELKEAIASLKEKLGRKVYLDELAEYMKISEEEVEDILKLAGEEVPKTGE